jgi:divalent metal cation (Fe/Co/Zn/Cd) transporter
MANGVDLINSIPEQLWSSISSLVTIFKAVGIMIILYLIFGIVNFILNKKKRNELKMINQNLIEIKKLLSKKK